MQYHVCFVFFVCVDLQELLAPVVQALVTVGRLFAVRLAGVLHPFAEQFRVLLEYQVLAEHGVRLNILRNARHSYE